MLRLFTFFLRPNRILHLIGSISLVILLFAYWGTYQWQWQPCRLCYYQQAAYGFAIITWMIAFIYFRHSPTKQRLCIKLLVLAFITSGSIALYHHLLQQGFIDTTINCSVNKTATSATDLLNQILVQDTPSCLRITSFLGLPLALWNLVLSMVFTCMVLMTLIFTRKS